MSYRRIARVSATTWILVADRSRAVIYQATWPYLEHYEEIHRIENPEETVDRDGLLSKRTSRFTGHGAMRQTSEPRINLRRKTALGMSLEIIQRLQQGRSNNEFGRLIIIAPAMMLGVLREQFPAPLAKTVALELRKQLVDSPVRQIMRHVEIALTEQEQAASQMVDS